MKCDRPGFLEIKSTSECRATIWRIKLVARWRLRGHMRGRWLLVHGCLTRVGLVIAQFHRRYRSNPPKRPIVEIIVAKRALLRVHWRQGQDAHASPLQWRALCAAFCEVFVVLMYGFSTGWPEVSKKRNDERGKKSVESNADRCESCSETIQWRDLRGGNATSCNTRS